MVNSLSLDELPDLIIFLIEFYSKKWPIIEPIYTGMRIYRIDFNKNHKQFVG